ncbi:MAG: PD40 domain-containing protein [Planctomycetes bacterium]|nr:PD40 domain-containing protein [Planctomycetota bacterium]
MAATYLARAIFLVCLGSALATPVIATAQGNKPGPPKLFVQNLGSNMATQLIEKTEFDGQGTPVWSPDGKQIGFDAWRASAGKDYGDAHVFVVNIDGSGLKDLGDGAMPSFSADVKRIAFSRYSPNRGVWIMNADGTNKELIDRSGWSARWSPDGKSIAYTKHVNGGPHFVIYDVKTKKQRATIATAADLGYRTIYWSFCWSPDSKRLCFKGGRANNKYDVAIVNIDGGERALKVLYTGKTGNGFSWHPAKKQILFDTVDPMRKRAQLFTVSTDVKGPPNAVPGQPAHRINTGGAWSPDGKRIVFTSRIRPKAK